VRGTGDQLAQTRSRGPLGQRRQHGEGLEDMGRSATRDRLHVVVDPQVVVAQGLGQFGQLDRAGPGIGSVPPGVLELPTLGDEDAHLEPAVHRGTAHWANSHHWISHIMGSRYRTYSEWIFTTPWSSVWRSM